MQLQNHLATLYQMHFIKDVQYRAEIAKLEDILQLCKDLTIPSSHHQFYNELKSQNQEEEDDHPFESEEEKE